MVNYDYLNYYALNKITIPDKFFILVIDELIGELVRVIVFSKLELKSSYHQIFVREEDLKKSTFQTYKEHYEFLVLSFGLLNALATFQSLMNAIF